MSDCCILARIRALREAQDLIKEMDPDWDLEGRSRILIERLGALIRASTEEASEGAGLADPQAAVDALNAAFNEDSRAIEALFECRVPFNAGLDGKPGMIVRKEEDDSLSLGIGGLLHVLVQGPGRVAQEVDQDGHLLGFHVIPMEDDQS